MPPALAHADQRQFGNTVYTPLPGWTEGRDDDGKLVLLPDLPDDLCEFCYIHLSASRPRRGSVAKYLNRENLLFVDEDDQDSDTVMGAPSVITLSGHEAAMQALKIGRTMQIVMAVSLGDRFEMFGFQGNAYDDEDAAESLSVFQTQVVPFFERFMFVSAGAAPLLPSPQPGNMNGVWWGWSPYSAFGLDMTIRQEMDFRTLIFWPDGFFNDGTPPEGLTPIKQDALQAKADTYFGIYQQSGNTLTLTFATGKMETLTAKSNDRGDGSKNQTQVQPFADGTALTGSISSVFFTGFTPGTGLEGGISSSSTTEFVADGTYSGESFGGAFSNFDGGGGFSIRHDGARGGNYTVQGGMVISTLTKWGGPNRSTGVAAG